MAIRELPEGRKPAAHWLNAFTVESRIAFVIPLKSAP